MRFIILIMISVFVLMPLSNVEAQKAKTIDELAKQFDSSQCKACHAEIYAQWEKSHHARPLMGVKGGLMLTPLALKKGTPGSTAFSEDDPKKMKIGNFPCFKCHLPQAVMHAEDSVAVELAEALLAKDSAKVAKLQITCIVCHNEKAIIHKRELGAPEKGVIYGKKDVPGHAGGPIKKSAIMKDSVFCGQCHGQGPNLEFDQAFQCANLYGSYLHNYVSGGGTKTCQECHMGAKSDHLIAPNFNDEKQTAELYGKALALDIETLGYEWLKKAGTYVPKVVVGTKLTSSAGHRIPDGWPSHNRVVMVVTAKAPDGKEIGKFERHYHPQATNCRDTKMKYGAQWKIANIRDTSIQPMTPKKETFEFDLPEGVRSADVTIEVVYEAVNPDNKYMLHSVTKKVSLDK